MKRDRQLSDVDVGPVNKKNLVVSLPPTEELVMAIAQVKDFVSGNASGSAFELSTTARNAHE